MFGSKEIKPGAVLGGAEGNRTPDLYNAIVALSQLSYGPNLKSGARGEIARESPRKSAARGYSQPAAAGK